MIPNHPYPGKWTAWRSPVKSHDRLPREIPALMILPYRHLNQKNVILQDLAPETGPMRPFCVMVQPLVGCTLFPQSKWFRPR